MQEELGKRVLIQRFRSNFYQLLDMKSIRLLQNNQKIAFFHYQHILKGIKCYLRCGNCIIMTLSNDFKYACNIYFLNATLMSKTETLANPNILTLNTDRVNIHILLTTVSHLYHSEIFFQMYSNVHPHIWVLSTEISNHVH